MDRHFLLIEDWYSYERINKDLCHKLMLLFALTTLPCATAVKAAAFPAHRTQPVADKRTYSRTTHSGTATLVTPFTNSNSSTGPAGRRGRADQWGQPGFRSGSGVLPERGAGVQVRLG